MTAYIHELPRSERPWAFGIEFDWSPEMVDALKNELPSRSRKWNPDARQWYVRESVIGTVLYLAKKHCGGHEWLEFDDADDARQDLTTDKALATLHLLPSAPPWLISTAYKALAKRMHPDAGGDLRAMQAVNAAYEFLSAVEVRE